MSKGKKDGGRGNERGRGDTVLHIACSNGNTALVELLLPRGGGGALADPPAKQGIAATRPKQPVTPPVDRSRLDKVELDRLDVAQAKQIVARDPDNPNWIAFTCAEAQWVPLSVDAEMSQHFAAREAVIETAKAQGNDEKIVEEWVGKAEQYLHTWVVRGILTSEKRAAHFRALGRGWVFIQLSSQRSSSGGHWTSANVTKRQITRFKWWFEGVERILRNRQDEFGTMRLAAEDVAKWTSGYVQGAELIFIIRGMVTEFSMMARVKLRSDYHREHVWASTAEVQQFVDAPMLTEEERGAHAKRAAALAAKKRAKRERQRKSRAERAEHGDDGEDEAKARVDGERARAAFDDLLDELKADFDELKADAACTACDDPGTGIAVTLT